MLRSVTGIVLASLLPAMVQAQPETPPKIKHVIYITLDGTRWQDIFIDKRLPVFWEKYASLGTWYGEPDSNRTIEVASVPISLPSYESQMSGYVQPCLNNECDRIDVETMPERLLKEFNFTQKNIATFSSWHVITNAIESVFGVTYSNVGNVSVYDPETHLADEEMERLNDMQQNDQPGDGDRYDIYTYAQAYHYFHKYAPAFLWLSLTDADEAAHQEDLEGYHKAFALYDRVLDKFFALIETMGIAKETMIIVTTDHGRGNGKNWTSHGPQLPASKRTWAFVYNGELKPVGQDGNMYRYSTLSMRPTIENALLGR